MSESLNDPVALGVDPAIRAAVLETQQRHDPANQGDVGFPGRCALCSFTRHPCEIHELATLCLLLLDERRPSG